MRTAARQLPLLIRPCDFHSDPHGAVQKYQNNQFDVCRLNLKPQKDFDHNVQRYYWDTVSRRLYFGGMGFIGYLDEDERTHELTLPRFHKAIGTLAGNCKEQIQ